ncbi:MAG: DUF1801 domain-containing protein [bacterium]
MTELKTQATTNSVLDFINSVENETQRQDAYTLLEIFKKATNEEPVMWGDKIVGFGKFSYKGSGSRCGEWFPVGFAPRKNKLVVYMSLGFDHDSEILTRLGKYKAEKACLYINKLSDVNPSVLEELISTFFKNFKV